MLPALSPTSNGAPAQAARSPSPEQSMKMSGAHRLPAGLGLDHQRVDALVVMHHHAGAERVKENVDLVGGQQIVGRDLVGRGVIGLRENFPENQMRRVQPAETVDPSQQIGGNALHHPMHLAMDIGMQPAEIGHARGRAHAAEKAIALDQQRAPPGARRSDRGGNAGRSAAEHGDFIFAVERNLACGFFDGFGRQDRVPGWRADIMPRARVLWLCVKGLRQATESIALVSRN